MQELARNFLLSLEPGSFRNHQVKNFQNSLTDHRRILRDELTEVEKNSTTSIDSITILSSQLAVGKFNDVSKNSFLNITNF